MILYSCKYDSKIPKYKLSFFRAAFFHPVIRMRLFRPSNHQSVQEAITIIVNLNTSGYRNIIVAVRFVVRYLISNQRWIEARSTKVSSQDNRRSLKTPTGYRENTINPSYVNICVPRCRRSKLTIVSRWCASEYTLKNCIHSMYYFKNCIHTICFFNCTHSIYGFNRIHSIYS